ncbi:MAG: hypothetical protein AAB487_00140, partial [Patescibacteria group bacterium]
MRKIYSQTQKMLNLENLVYLTVVGLPLYLVKVNFFGLPTNVLEILEATVFFTWLLDKNYPKPKAHMLFFAYKKYIISISLIIFGLLASTWFNGNYRIGLGIIKGWFILPILFTVAVLNIFDRTQIPNIFKAFFVSALAVSLAALGWFFFGRLTYDGRLAGPFNSPNYLAMYLAPAVIIGVVLAQIQSLESKTKKVLLKTSTFYHTSLALLLIPLYLTHSFAAWAALVISLLIREAITKGKSILKSKVFWSSAILMLLFFSVEWNSGKLR